MQTSALPIRLIKRHPFWAHGNNSLAQARYSSSSYCSRTSRNHQLWRVCGLLLTIVFSILAHPAHVKATQNARTYSASECSGLCVSGDDPSTATALARQAALISSNSINRQTILGNASLALAPASTARLTLRQPCRQYERWRKESYRGDPVGFDVRQAEQCRSIYKPFGT